MTTVEKLCAIIKEKFGRELDPKTFRRTRAGHNQRSSGAFSWWMYEIGTLHSIGSCESISYLLKNKDRMEIYTPWTLSDVEIVLSDKNNSHVKMPDVPAGSPGTGYTSV